MDNLHQFLHANRAEWPLGQMQTIHQTHLMPADGPFTHPLLADEFLRTADVIHVTIQGPKPLKLSAIKEFMRQIAKVAPNGIRDFDVQPGTLVDGVVVSILAGRLNEWARAQSLSLQRAMSRLPTTITSRQ